MIGLAVVVFVAVFAQGFKSSFVDSVDRRSGALRDQRQAGPDHTGVGDRPVYTVPGVANAAGITAPVRGEREGTTKLFGVDPTTFGSMWRFHWLKGGSDQLLGRLQGDNALVEEQFAVTHKLSIGKTFNALGQPARGTVFTVIGEYRDPTLPTGFVVDADHLRRARPGDQRDPFWIIARDAGPDQPRQAGLKALKPFPRPRCRPRRSTPPR